MAGPLAVLGNSAPPITVTASPLNAFGARSGAGSVDTNFVTVTATGGIGAFTYAWTKTSGDAITVDNASAATTLFAGTVGIGERKFAIYRCTVTDSYGTTSYIEIPVTLLEVSFK